MTRFVLLIGFLFAALLALLWIVFTVVPTLANTGFAQLDSILQILRVFAAFNGYNDSTPFRRTGPVFELWFVCLLVAVVSDTFIKPAARTAVSAFAASLSPEGDQVACEIKQRSSWTGEIRTMTSGKFKSRRTTVLIFQRPKLSYLTVEMACRIPWELEIRNRNLISQVLAFVGSPVDTGDGPLDEAVAIQGDDEAAIQTWARAAAVQRRILTLFQVYKTTSLTTEIGSEGDQVLRARYHPFRPRFFPADHAVGILDDVAELAAIAEAVSAHRIVS